MLPARVRLSHPPLPLSPALIPRLAPLLPGAPHEQATAAVLAVAGSRVVGAGLRWPGGALVGVDPAWRGRGIEAALQAAIAPA